MTAYKLAIVKDSEPSIFDSKFGGVPYWDMSEKYPTDSQGDKMMLLAQINFSKAGLEDDYLPQQGMLQFFISAEDNVYGLDFDQPDSQNDFRVVFHNTINASVTKQQVLELDIPVATDEDNEYTPVFEEVAVELYKNTVYMGTEVINFDHIFAEALKELTGEDIGNKGAYEYLSEEDNNYLYYELCNIGHWVLGYPYFTQYDPRENVDEQTKDYYDTLLFQMDSEMVDGKDYVLWGDCGVANFFINGEALKNKDFSKVMYNWDCC
jgi:uncharacterized protein YwqG